MITLTPARAHIYTYTSIYMHSIYTYAKIICDPLFPVDWVKWKKSQLFDYLFPIMEIEGRLQVEDCTGRH